MSCPLIPTCCACESWGGFTHSVTPLYENDIIVHVFQKLSLCFLRVRGSKIIVVDLHKKLQRTKEAYIRSLWWRSKSR
jgi:hypothetical protein